MISQLSAITYFTPRYFGTQRRTDFLGSVSSGGATDFGESGAENCLRVVKDEGGEVVTVIYVCEPLISSL